MELLQLLATLIMASLPMVYIGFMIYFKTTKTDSRHESMIIFDSIRHHPKITRNNIDLYE